MTKFLSFVIATLTIAIVIADVGKASFPSPTDTHTEVR
jgi:hypothetical protein